MFCNKCGNEIPDDNKYCLKCGNQIISDETVKDKEVEKG
ncbi:zinc-ribbon domain-containing protein [Caloranaerobacter sp. DY30410]